MTKHFTSQMAESTRNKERADGEMGTVQKQVAMLSVETEKQKAAHQAEME